MYMRQLKPEDFERGKRLGGEMGDYRSVSSRRPRAVFGFFMAAESEYPVLIS
jgi:hypothetical protein